MGVKHLELRGMIDEAVGHPEMGIVNLNVLHSLLHEILNHLDKETSEKDVVDDKAGLEQERNVLESKLNESDRPTFSDQKKSRDHVAVSREELASDSSPSKLHDFEERLVSIETKLEALSRLPDDKSFLTQTTHSNDNQTAQSDKENTLAMMWKYMTIHRRVQATEEAVEKVMNILNDVIKDMGELKKIKSNLEELRHEQMKTTGDFQGDRTNDKNRAGLSDIGKFDSLDNVAFKKDLASFVTWTALEQALNNKKIEANEMVVGLDNQIEQVSSERPDTAPVSSSPLEPNVEQQPPKTAMSPKEYTKLTGQDPDEINMYTTHQEGKEGSLWSKEDSLGEISLSHDLNGNVISRENTLESVTQPSPEFLSQLNRIGELPKQYDDVAVQVSLMSELQTQLASEVHKVEVDILPRKVDKEDLQLPDNLVGQIDLLKQGLDMLNTNQDLQMLAAIKETTVQNKENIDILRRELSSFSQHLKRLDQSREVKEPEANVPSYDLEVLNSVREKLNNVEEEQEKMTLKSKGDIDKILQNLDEKQRIIDDLFQYVERLQERKADRENVATEMDVKADKHALDGKVNRSTFEETFQMFDRGLQEALQKMEDYMNEEMALKDTLSRISHEMEGKIDNDSLQLMKDYFEKQIKDVQESRDKIARETRVDAVDAAGVRRKLPVHYHCISCNRPVELPVRDSEPALPESESLPLRRLKFPFTSYEVEQLRQKSMKGAYNAEESAALRELISGRPCGGSHTVINSQLRKSTKFHQFNQTTAVREDPRFVPKMVREVSVLDFLRGSDGHYYKGRSRQLLPAIPRRTKYPGNSDVSVDSGSMKGNEETSHITEQPMPRSHYRLRTPSPPVQDNLSSSYPERSEPKEARIQRQHSYSSDDISIPSNTALNRESLKIFRRKRGQDKENRRQRCWDNQLTNTKGETQERCSDSNESSSPKSIKRTTPVGEEQPQIASPESSPHKPVVHNENSSNKSRISDGSEKK